MVNGEIGLGPGTDDLGLQRGDPTLQFLDRKRIEILPRQLGEEVVVTLRGKIVGLHVSSVDRRPAHVNKPDAEYDQSGQGAQDERAAGQDAGDRSG